jgi:hypothetical protein
MEKTNDSEKTLEQKKVQEKQDKSLEESLQENGFNYDYYTLEKIKKGIMSIKKFDSDTVAEIQLKQIVNSGQDPVAYLQEFQIEINTNDNNVLLDKIKSIAENEKKQYHTLVKPLLETQSEFLEKTFLEKLKIGWYKFTGNIDKTVYLNDQINKRNISNILTYIQDNLEHKLEKTNHKKSELESIIKRNKSEVNQSFKSLYKIKRNVEENKEITKSAEIELALLEDQYKTAEENNSVDKDKLKDEIKKIKSSVNSLNKQSDALLKSARIKQEDYVTEFNYFQENSQCKKFYDSLSEDYVTKIRDMNKIIEKTEKELSMNEIYKEAKEFAKDDKIFSELTKIRREQELERGFPNLEINRNKMPTQLVHINSYDNDIDYHIGINEGFNQLSKFLESTEELD